MNETKVWVFNGTTGRFPSGIFSSPDEAESWISAQKLTGTLTGYPLNTGVFDWAFTKGYFKPESAFQKTPDFVGNFSCASLEHFHYENGERD